METRPNHCWEIVAHERTLDIFTFTCLHSLALLYQAQVAELKAAATDAADEATQKLMLELEEAKEQLAEAKEQLAEAKEQLALSESLAADFAATQADLKGVKAELELAQSDLSLAKGELAEKAEVASTLAGELDWARSELAQVQGELAQKAELAEKADSASSLAEELALVKGELAEKAELASSLADKVVQMQGDLAEKADSASSLAEELAQVQGELAEKAELSSRLEEDLSRAQAEVDICIEDFATEKKSLAEELEAERERLIAAHNAELEQAIAEATEKLLGQLEEAKGALTAESDAVQTLTAQLEAALADAETLSVARGQAEGFVGGKPTEEGDGWGGDLDVASMGGNEQREGDQATGMIDAKGGELAEIAQLRQEKEEYEALLHRAMVDLAEVEKRANHAECQLRMLGQNAPTTHQTEAADAAAHHTEAAKPAANDAEAADSAAHHVEACDAAAAPQDGPDPSGSVQGHSPVEPEPDGDAVAFGDHVTERDVAGGASGQMARGLPYDDMGREGVVPDASKKTPGGTEGLRENADQLAAALGRVRELEGLLEDAHMGHMGVHSDGMRSVGDGEGTPNVSPSRSPAARYGVSGGRVRVCDRVRVL